MTGRYRPNFGSSLADHTGDNGRVFAQGMDANFGELYPIFQRGVPSGVAPNGTMGNNGAVTLGTALDKTYSNGIYLSFPAGAIAAGVPAAQASYYVVMSSATVGQVYNNVLPANEPIPPASPTAFSTTGPGAYTQVISTQFSLASYTIPANSMGKYGMLRLEGMYSSNKTSNNKNCLIRFGGTSVMQISAAAGNLLSFLRTIKNIGATNDQLSESLTSNSTTIQGSGQDLIHPAIDTTADAILLFSANVVTATDWVFLMPTLIELMPAI